MHSELFSNETDFRSVDAMDADVPLNIDINADADVDVDIDADEGSSMLATTIRVVIDGMTCQKCERLIREALLEKVTDVVAVDVDRPGGFADVEVKMSAWTSERQRLSSEIIEVIQELVNGKFKARIHGDDKKNKSSKKLGDYRPCKDQGPIL